MLDAGLTLDVIIHDHVIIGNAAEFSFKWGTTRVVSKLASFLVLSVWATVAPAEQQEVTIKGELRVFDGDTLEVGPLLIRLHGIDAPERGQKCKAAGGGEWRCGSDASNRLAELIAGEELSCEALDRDPYGRVISRCSAGGVDLATVLVEEGLAWAFVEYSKDYVKLEDAVWPTGSGIWQAHTQTAEEFRDDKWNRAVAEAPDGECPIKGNINSDKEKIYHTPWSPNYLRTEIDTEKDERWFCDEGEALAAGWRPVDGR
jgi:endonuclease YncB( thermonuclease family)